MGLCSRPGKVTGFEGTAAFSQATSDAIGLGDDIFTDYSNDQDTTPSLLRCEGLRPGRGCFFTRAKNTQKLIKIEMKNGHR